MTPQAAVAELSYREASAADSELLLRWRNDPVVRRASREQDVISTDDHERWLGPVMADPDRLLLVAEAGGRPVGSVRFDVDGAVAEISLIVASERRGGGLGSTMARDASASLFASRPAVAEVVANVREGNAASLGAFQRAGFRPVGDVSDPGWTRLTLERSLAV